MDRGNTITFYTNRAHNTTTGATAEGSAATATEDTYASYDVVTAMYTGLAYLSRQLIEDAAPAALMSVIANDVSRVVARKAETGYHIPFLAYDSTDADSIAESYDRTTKMSTESGANDPKIKRVNMLNLIFGLDEGFLASPSVVALTRAQSYNHMLRLTYGTQYPVPVYQTNTILGAPLMVEGFRLAFDQFLPAIVAAAASGPDQEAIVIGDMNRAFHIVDVGGIRVDMSKEYKFAEQQVTVLASLRTGGAIKDPTAARIAMTDGST